VTEPVVKTSKQKGAKNNASNDCFGTSPENEQLSKLAQKSIEEKVTAPHGTSEEIRSWKSYRY